MLVVVCVLAVCGVGHRRRSLEGSVWCKLRAVASYRLRHWWHRVCVFAALVPLQVCQVPWVGALWFRGWCIVVPFPAPASKCSHGSLIMRDGKIWEVIDCGDGEWVMYNTVRYDTCTLRVWMCTCVRPCASGDSTPRARGRVCLSTRVCGCDQVKGSSPVTVGRMTYIQLDLRDITSGAFVPTRYRMSEDVELAPLEDPEPFSFLYSTDSGNTFIFMQQHSFEQVSLVQLRALAEEVKPGLCGTTARLRLACVRVCAD